MQYFPDSISFTGGWHPDYSPYIKNVLASTDTSVFYDLDIANNVGIEFRHESDGSTSIYANTGDNTSDPYSLTLTKVDGTISTGAHVSNIEVGDVVSDAGHFTFTITNSLIFVPTGPTGPTVTQERTTHTGIVLHGMNPEIFTPTGVMYDKTGPHRFRIKFYDANMGTYNVTTTWQTTSGTASDTVGPITTASGDLQLTLDFSNSNASDQPITGPITVTFDINLYWNGDLYVSGTNVLTFQYYTVGPYTAFFSPNYGNPGQSITVVIEDENPYPEANSSFQFEQSPGVELVTATLTDTNNYQLSIPDAFTSKEGTYRIYKSDNTIIATATYAQMSEARGTNAAGKPDRYPMIMTNLFNRSRSVFSIGLTHKDKWDLFL